MYIPFIKSFSVAISRYVSFNILLKIQYIKELHEKVERTKRERERK